MTFRRVLFLGIANVGLGAIVALAFFAWLAVAQPHAELAGADAAGEAGVVSLGTLLLLVVGTSLAADLGLGCGLRASQAAISLTVIERTSELSSDLRVCAALRPALSLIRVQLS